jgi:hypothetical protein
LVILMVPNLTSVVRAAALALAAGVATGCYSHVSLPSPAPVGREIQLDINDRGRVALGDSLGPSVRFVDGRLASVSESTYVLNVSSVGYVNGTENKWSGERLAVRSSLVGSVREKRLDRGRTFLTIGAAVVATVAFIVTRSLAGSGSPTVDGPAAGNSNGQ